MYLYVCGEYMRYLFIVALLSSFMFYLIFPNCFRYENLSLTVLVQHIILLMHGYYLLIILILRTFTLSYTIFL